MSKSCEICFGVEDVEPRPAHEGLWEFTCTNSAKHPSGRPHQWFGFNEPVKPGEAGDSLDPYGDALLATFTPGGPFLEFPIVEWRFRARAGAIFDELVASGGHILLKPNDTKERTASIVLVQALGHLRNSGHLVGMHGPATAPWLKQKTVTYWALPPEPLKVNAVSWVDYAAANEISVEQVLRGPSGSDDLLP